MRIKAKVTVQKDEEARFGSDGKVENGRVSGERRIKKGLGG